MDKSLFKSKSKGGRPNPTNIKIGCPFLFNIRTTEDGQGLQVTAFSGLHNHKVRELEYKFHPNVWQLDPDTNKLVAEHLQVKCQ